MDKRIRNISKVLTAYSAGHFDKRMTLSSQLDEIDVVISGVNMLGEELREITVSRNYFNNIFNSVSDMVFVVSREGCIIDLNKQVTIQLGYEGKQLLNKPFDRLQQAEQSWRHEDILRELRRKNGLFSKDVSLQKSTGDFMPVSLNASFLADEKGRKVALLLIASDRTAQVKAENMIIRSIIDTQEKERFRLARDLHDSLGQQLAAIRFHIAASASACDDKEQQAVLQESHEALGHMITDMRNMCFDLLPRTLEQGGLVPAVKELARQTRSMAIRLKCDASFPELPRNIAVDIFRIIQEFAGNAQRHGKAGSMTVEFSHSPYRVGILLKDNGIGFHPDKITSGGMGIQNVRSRVRSHGGNISISSAPAKGTTYRIIIPLNP